MPNQTKLTDSEKPALVGALEAALRVAAKERSADYGLFFQVLTLRDKPDSALKELRDLLSLIQSIPSLECFNHADQCALGSWQRVDYRFLVRWLISRGQQVGAKQAVDDVARYLDTKALEITTILAIDGLYTKQSIELGEYELISWNNVAMTDTKWHIMARSLGNRVPSAAVIQRHEVQRIHVRPWNAPEDPNLPPSIEPAQDILRCASAVAGAGFRLLHYWHEPPEWAAWAVSPSAFGVDSTAFPRPVELIDALIPQLQKSVSHFRGLDENKRLRLRIPLDRLNRSYLAGMRNVDRAIELGIALESLYAPVKLSEGIAYAVRTRVARFLGGSFEERKHTLDIIRDVYVLRSIAVHAGRFDVERGPTKWRKDPHVTKVLDEGQRCVGRSLVKVIEEGEPNWAEFDIQ